MVIDIKNTPFAQISSDIIKKYNLIEENNVVKRICKICNNPITVNDFYTDITCHIGIGSTCKFCLTNKYNKFRKENRKIEPKINYPIDNNIIPIKILEIKIIPEIYIQNDILKYNKNGEILFKCRCCGEYKTISNFGIMKSNKWGIKKICKQCLYPTCTPGPDPIKLNEIKSLSEIDPRFLQIYPIIEDNGIIKLKCNRCNKYLDIKNYHNSNVNALGVVYKCMQCFNQHYYDNVEEIKKKGKIKYYQNREYLLQRGRERRLQNLETILETERKNFKKKQIIKKQENYNWLCEQLNKIENVNINHFDIKNNNLFVTYLLEFKDLVKIGCSGNFIGRLNSLAEYFGEYKIIRIFVSDKENNVYDLENYLQIKFENFNLHNSIKANGYTEFYKKECLQDLITEMDKFPNVIKYK